MTLEAFATVDSYKSVNVEVLAKYLFSSHTDLGLLQKWSRTQNGQAFKLTVNWLSLLVKSSFFGCPANVMFC